MNVETYSKSVISRVYVDTRRDCSDKDKADIYYYLAEYFAHKAETLAVDVPAPVEPKDFEEGGMRGTDDDEDNEESNSGARPEL